MQRWHASGMLKMNTFIKQFPINSICPNNSAAKKGWKLKTDCNDKRKKNFFKSEMKGRQKEAMKFFTIALFSFKTVKHKFQCEWVARICMNLPFNK